jgi:hypothetical protein
MLTYWMKRHFNTHTVSRHPSAGFVSGDSATVLARGVSRFHQALDAIQGCAIHQLELGRENRMFVLSHEGIPTAPGR